MFIKSNKTRLTVLVLIMITLMTFQPLNGSARPPKPPPANEVTLNMPASADVGETVYATVNIPFSFFFHGGGMIHRYQSGSWVCVRSFTPTTGVNYIAVNVGNTPGTINFMVTVYLDANTYRDTDTIVVQGNEVIKYAVLVGLNDYTSHDDYASFGCADESINEWYALLIDEYGFNEDNILVYGDSYTDFTKYQYRGSQQDVPEEYYATEDNVRTGLTNMINNADENDIICYITLGHGENVTVAGHAYHTLIMSGYDGINIDVTQDNAEDNILTDVELASIFDDASAAKIFISIDHCFSGGFILELSSCASISKMLIITACTDLGYCWIFEGTYNFRWSYYLVRAMEEQVPSDPIEFAYEQAEAIHDAWVDGYSQATVNDKSEMFDGNVNSYFYL